ncbi:MAG: site-2 protease family protein [Deltaproteobacteria bacterium]|nr:site-2 protease family protein [Deltaproteobacteria bacterium]
MNAEWLVNGLVQYVVLIFSMTVHEAAHAWWAMRNGDLTAYLGGQVSFDPIPHIRREPMGMIFIPLLTYALNGWMMGWASAPLSVQWILNNPRKAAAVSLAGPLSNLAVAITVAVLIRVLVGTGTITPGSVYGFDGSGVALGFGYVLWSFFFLNTVLFVFNMLPIPPLDGSSAIGLLLDEDTAYRLQTTIRQPMVAMMGLVFFFVIGGKLASPVIGALVSLLFIGM